MATRLPPRLCALGPHTPLLPPAPTALGRQYPFAYVCGSPSSHAWARIERNLANLPHQRFTVVPPFLVFVQDMLCRNKKILVAELQQTTGCTFDLVGGWWRNGDSFNASVMTLNEGLPKSRSKDNRDGVIKGNFCQLATFGEIQFVFFIRFAAERCECWAQSSLSGIGNPREAAHAPANKCASMLRALAIALNLSSVKKLFRRCSAPGSAG